MRCSEIKRGESKLASSHFLMCALQSGRSEVFTELYGEEEWEEVDRGGQEDKREAREGERQILPVTSS